MKYDTVLLSRVIRAWRRRSVWGFSRLLIYNLGLMATGKYSEINRPFDQSLDRVYNVESAGTEEPKFLTAEEALKAHAKGYEPTTKEQIEALLGMLPRLDLTDFIFVDFGSGKGRALFVAAEHPFRQIIGVEYSRELHETAMRNIHTYRNPSQKCFNITPVRADATTFSVPEFPTICFMNNPYDENAGGHDRETCQSVDSVGSPPLLHHLYQRILYSALRYHGWMVAYMLRVIGEIALCYLAMDRG
jgi:hypothetical protein